jgi:hypothetical protein
VTPWGLSFDMYASTNREENVLLRLLLLLQLHLLQLDATSRLAMAAP